MAVLHCMASQRPMRRWAILVTVLAVLTTACGEEEPVGAAASNEVARSSESRESSSGPREQATSSTAVAATAVATTATSTTVTTSTTLPLATATVASTEAAAVVTEVDIVPSATLPPTAGSGTFSARIETITDGNADRLALSWRTGCPVGLEGLRLLTMSHWNFAGVAATGELVVAAESAEDIVDVFETLFEARFPIERMQLVDEYAGDDDLSMAANNTSAFNCREVAWKPGVWSNHAFGTAIDVNPLVNPYVSTSRILPPEGSAFVDRSSPTLGGLYSGDVATVAFADIGWIWGGTWQSAKDWQHFSASGG